MDRLLVLWTSPCQFSPEEAKTWARAELRQLASIETIERASLTPLASAGDRHGRSWDWLLELHLAEDASADDCVEAEACRAWLDDLRSLRLQPTVFVAGGPVPLGDGER